MTKILLNLTRRQHTVYKMMSEQWDLSMAELLRRALDHYIENLIKEGTLVRFDCSSGEKTAAIEVTKQMYDNLVRYAEENPDGALKKIPD